MADEQVEQTTPTAWGPDDPAPLPSVEPHVATEEGRQELADSLRGTSERDGTAPEQIDPEPEHPTEVEPAPERLVDLVALVSDEFAITRPDVQMMMALGTLVTIDGDVETPVPITGNIWVRYEDIQGKTVRLKGETRAVQFFYDKA
jgi:hypothetical protein